MKFPSHKWLQVKVKPTGHKKIEEYAKENGMTITSMIKIAIKKVFNIEL